MKSAFFVGNRTRLIEALQGGLVVMTAYNDMQRSNDMAHHFEQEANFWYLTGVESSRWKLIIDGQRRHTWLVAPQLSEVEKVFDGTIDHVALKAASGVDEIIEFDEFEPLLRQLLRKHSTVHTLDYVGLEQASFVLNPAQRQLTGTLQRIFGSVVSCQPELSRLRAIKQLIEVQAMQRAVRVTVDAFRQMQGGMDKCRYEYELEAIMGGYFRSKNAQHAYDPIVATGKNACILHYTANDARLSRRQLVLFDVGARVGGYAADISRTYSLGVPSRRQATIHSALADAQRQIIKLLRPGLPVMEYQASVDQVMTSTMRSVGLDTGDDEKTLRKYMPHSIGHGIGIDVHESLGRPKILEAGMTLTVEPGIYIPDESIGIRIEDDVLITASGHQVLSRALSTSLL